MTTVLASGKLICQMYHYGFLFCRNSARVRNDSFPPPTRSAYQQNQGEMAI